MNSNPRARTLGHICICIGRKLRLGKANFHLKTRAAGGSGRRHKLADVFSGPFRLFDVDMAETHLKSLTIWKSCFWLIMCGPRADSHFSCPNDTPLELHLAELELVKENC